MDEYVNAQDKEFSESTHVQCFDAAVSDKCAERIQRWHAPWPISFVQEHL